MHPIDSTPFRSARSFIRGIKCLGNLVMGHALQLGFVGIYGWCYFYPQKSTNSAIFDAFTRDHEYVTLKVYERDSGQVERSSDNFEVSTLSGRHLCLVHPPLGVNLSNLREKMPGKEISEKLLKSTLKHLLLALDFLHTEAHIIHTDIQEKNILLGIEDPTILSHFEEDEQADPSPRKIDGTRIIYRTRHFQTPKQYGRPIICDFGEARSGSLRFHEDIQPYLYRTPEVLLRMVWDCKVDIWNVGVMDSNGQDSNLHHLAEMVALLGPPPRDFLQRSDYASEFFDENGNWKGGIEIPPVSLEAGDSIMWQANPTEGTEDSPAT
ncbi:CMGC/SRPK protein kinase [Polytolypa hystricis UAMH7299]|uniref:non-specific serine/threonine protein kinase n=1 Tax=Polytolypa hystricis (strain UAMH7299) TaxID=1447883 RepID=A0A2B7XRA4_POLH7|nr:CMGC/SRPK protein kinase [Polytolypa hystricis UAMH7299]